VREMTITRRAISPRPCVQGAEKAKSEAEVVAAAAVAEAAESKKKAAKAAAEKAAAVKEAATARAAAAAAEVGRCRLTLSNPS